MTPGERIKAITRIADALEGVTWSEVELTLRQFGIKTMSWDGRKWDYVLAVLEDASDDKLLALQEFVGGVASGPGNSAPGGETRSLPWEGSRFRLFASHQTADKVLVSEVKQKLAVLAVDVFVAHQDIKPSKEWLEEIDLSLDTCDALAAFLTPDFHRSDWCDQEVGFAMRRRVLIVPLSFGITPYGFMNRYQSLKADKMSPSEIAASIFDILVSEDLTAARMSEAIVNYTAEASSFDQANDGSKLLNRVTLWTPELLRKLEESIESNRQVNGAFSAPGRIRSILTKNRS